MHYLIVTDLIRQLLAGKQPNRSNTVTRFYEALLTVAGLTRSRPWASAKAKASTAVTKPRLFESGLIRKPPPASSTIRRDVCYQ